MNLILDSIQNNKALYHLDLEFEGLPTPMWICLSTAVLGRKKATGICRPPSEGCLGLIWDYEVSIFLSFLCVCNLTSFLSRKESHPSFLLVMFGVFAVCMKHTYFNTIGHNQNTKYIHPPQLVKTIFLSGGTTGKGCYHTSIKIWQAWTRLYSYPMTAKLP